MSPPRTRRAPPRTVRRLRRGEINRDPHPRLVAPLLLLLTHTHTPPVRTPPSPSVLRVDRRSKLLEVKQFKNQKIKEALMALNAAHLTLFEEGQRIFGAQRDSIAAFPLVVRLACGGDPGCSLACL